MCRYWIDTTPPSGARSRRLSSCDSVPWWRFRLRVIDCCGYIRVGDVVGSAVKFEVAGVVAWSCGIVYVAVHVAPCGGLELVVLLMLILLLLLLLSSRLVLVLLAQDAHENDGKGQPGRADEEHHRRRKVLDL